MNKAKLFNNHEFGIVRTRQTELTLEDIKNNLKKPAFNDFVDLNNVYEFLNRVDSSKGRAGFVTIKKETRKRSYEKGLENDSDFNEFTLLTKKIREKSLAASPVLNSPVFSPKNVIKRPAFQLKSIDGLQIKKQVKPISIKNNVKSPVLKGITESTLKHKVILRDLETTRERALSPYAIALQKSAGRLPLLQTTKKRIGVLNFEKTQKKSKVKK
jgi:hypothetical protein